MTLRILHIFLCPTPNFIKFCLVTHLNTNHQTIRHTFGTNILITSIIDICHIISNLIIHGILTIYAKKVTPHLLHLLVNLSLRLAQIFHKQVGIYASKICTVSNFFAFKRIATRTYVSFVDKILRNIACNFYIIMRIVATATSTAIFFFVAKGNFVKINTTFSTTNTERHL